MPNTKKLQLGRISVSVRHGKVATEHCRDCGEVAEGRTGKIDRFEREIAIEGEVDAMLRVKLLEIADKCRHRTLEQASAIVTRIAVSPESRQQAATFLTMLATTCRLSSVKMTRAAQAGLRMRPVCISRLHLVRTEPMRTSFSKTLTANFNHAGVTSIAHNRERS